MIATWIARFVELYAVVGILFSIGFAARGVTAIDSAARGTRMPFRLLVMPGAALLWPLLAVRWRRS